MLVTFFNVLSAQPIIQSFSPIIAKAADQVTITGSRFSSVASSNIVYFGKSKATVISAQSTALVVAVPMGATYGPLSVTVNGLTALSSLSFAPTFVPGPAADDATFTNAQSIVGDYYPNNVVFADLDLDDRLDVVALKFRPGNVEPSYLLTYRNAGASAFAIDLNLQGTYLTGFFSSDMKLADFDGDGRLDVATCNIANKEIAVLRNTSTNGQISFVDRVLFTTLLTNNYIATGDIDGDGKIDIVGTNLLSGTVTILRNQSTAGNISFLEAPSIPVGLTPFNLAITDLNGDHKPDLVIANKLVNTFSIYPNTSAVGSFSFGTPFLISTPDNLEARDIASGDLNMDGKNDLIVTTSNNIETTGHIYTFRNTGSGGNLNFSNDGALSNTQPEMPDYAPFIGDVNGDGKVDILTGDRRLNNPVDIYQNQSAASMPLSFVLAGSLNNNSSPNTLAIGDLNGDGRPEIGTSALIGISGYIYINKTGLLSIANIDPATAGDGDTVTISGKNFTGASLVSFGGVNAASFSVVSNTLIKAVVGPGASGDVIVTAPAGSDSWKGYQGFTYNNDPVIDSISASMGFPGDTVLIRGRHLLHTTSIILGGKPVLWFSVINSTTVKIIPDPTSSGFWITLTTPSGLAYSQAAYIFLKRPRLTGFTPDSAYEGQDVAIFGENLLTPGFLPTITIGGVPATFVYDNGNQTILNIAVGAGASGNIKISHFGGSDSIPGFIFIPPPVINAVFPQSAKPADTVLIKGHNFLRASQVYFGDSAAASFIIINDSTIKAVVGHGKSGSIKIDKYSGSGLFAGFTFIPLGVPTIQSFAPIKAISGTVITLTGQNLWGILSVKVGNTFVKSFEQLSPGQLKITAPIDASGPITVATYYGSSTLAAPVFTRILPPTISSFTPSSGIPGSAITIYGTGFGIDPAAVKVFFGTIKATVNTVQDNIINATVPEYGSLCTISVTCNHLTAFSSGDFNPVNPSIADLDLNENSFENIRETVNVQQVEASAVYAVDLNGDSKPDFITSNTLGYAKYYKNISAPGEATWIYEGDLPNLKYVTNLHAGDIDGDGKTDLILCGQGPALFTFRNTSTPDSIGFEQVSQHYSNDIIMGDINSDGKPDMLRLDATRYNLQFILNNSVPGLFIFTDTLNLQLNQPYENLILNKLVDIDNDELLDLVLLSNNLTLLFRNTGNKKVPIFNTAPTICRKQGNDGYVTLDVKTVDMNSDKLPDLVAAYNGGLFGLYKNISTPGQIAFKPNQLFSNDQSGTFESFNISDFNGDNKPDIATGSAPSLFLYQNASTADSIILKGGIKLQSVPGIVCVADMDGDNKQDLVSSSDPYFIIRNRMMEPRSVNICPNTTVVLPANKQGSSFQWQMDAGTGFSNIADNDKFSGTNGYNLTINNVPSDWLKRKFRCIINNGITGEPYFLEFTNNWISNTSNDWNNPANWSCGVVPDGNTMVVISNWKNVFVTQHSACRSLKIDQYATFTIAPGIQLLITNK